MPTNAPYTGGVSPGAKLFAVDGDFSQAAPCGAPEISNPFNGDSFPDINDIVLLNSSGAFVEIPVGSGYNIQPFSANQSAIIIEQEFMVAQQYFQPLPLNTPYYVPWSIGWLNTYIGLGSCFLVSEGPLQDVGGGIVKFRRKYANLPNTRNELESYSASFPALSGTAGSSAWNREAFTRIVSSRVQFDYYVFDDLNLLPIPVFPSGHLLNTSTGVAPVGLILPEQKYFLPDPGTGISAIAANLFADTLTDGSTGPATNPTTTQYLGWVSDGSEIVAEASSLNKWMGNIYERKTRFVRAQ